MRKSVVIKTAYGAHTVTLERDGKGFLVVGKDIDGVTTWGKNLAEAKQMAKEAVELAVESTVFERIHAMATRPTRQVA